MNRVASAVLIGLLSLCGTMAFADDEVPEKHYVAIKGGQFTPNTDIGTSSTGLKNFDTGFNVELLIGQRVNKYFAFDTGIGYYTKLGTLPGFSVATRNNTPVNTGSPPNPQGKPEPVPVMTV